MLATSPNLVLGNWLLRISIIILGIALAASSERNTRIAPNARTGKNLLSRKPTPLSTAPPAPLSALFNGVVTKPIVFQAF